MTRSRMVPITLVVLLLSASVHAEGAPPKPRLAVLDFTVVGKVEPSGGPLLAAFVRDEIHAAGKYDLMDRNMMRQRLTEKDFAATVECDQLKCMIRYGTSLEVQKIVGGRIGSFGEVWTLDMRLVDVNTGREEAVFARKHVGQMEELLDIAREGARELLGLPPTKSITKSKPETPFKGLTLDLGGGVTMKLLPIQAGEFLMGSAQSPEEVARLAGGKPVWFKMEHPLHRVKITKPFYLGKYEVTQAQWRAVMGNNPAKFKGDRLPVEQVSWNDCQEFCRKLSRRMGCEVRLPTEAEWEYACRAGTTSPFYFGDTISTDQANYNGNYTYGSGRKGVYREKTVWVGSFSANAWGLHDMHGNVWEWCADVVHDSYCGAPVDGSAWIADGDQTRRVCRGGSWYSRPSICRSAIRGRVTPGGCAHAYGGFRVAADIE